MIIISNKGNIEGDLTPDTENSPEAIERAITKYGLDVKIDIWVDENLNVFLGEIYGIYPISVEFIINRHYNLWIQCRNLNALSLMSSLKYVNFFWHEEDTYAVTSKGHIWSYPGVESNSRTILVDNEGNLPEHFPCGICTNFPLKLI